MGEKGEGERVTVVRETYVEPAQASPVVRGLVLQDAEALKVDEKVIPMSLMRCDVEDEEIEHGDESEAFVELGHRFQDP